MKLTKKLTSLLLAVVMCLSLSVPAFAGEEPALEKSENYDMAAVLPQEIPDSIYGGIYYEDDVLIVNLVGNKEKRLSLQNEIAQYASEKDRIEYQEVTYPLAELERLKDSLAEQMREYSIVVLDANEVTNTLDVTLQQLNPKIISAIQDWIQQQGYPVSILRFDEMGDSTVQSTVAYEKPTTVDLPVSENSVSPTASTTRYISGGRIQINNGYYTLGPAVSTSKAYSAGHGFSGTGSIKDNAGLTIGTATSHFGGAEGDWSSLTINNGECSPTVGKVTPIAGATVYMFGATSGETSGKTVKTNVTVAATTSPVTLTGMCSASYSCASGDSGAGIFNCNFQTFFSGSSSAKTYGIQSMGVFSSAGTWNGTSYFTPITKVS